MAYVLGDFVLDFAGRVLDGVYHWMVGISDPLCPPGGKNTP